MAYRSHEAKVQHTKTAIGSSEEIARVRVCVKESALQKLHQVAVHGCCDEWQQVLCVAFR